MPMSTAAITDGNETKKITSGSFDEPKLSGAIRYPYSSPEPTMTKAKTRVQASQRAHKDDRHVIVRRSIAAYPHYCE